MFQNLIVLSFVPAPLASRPFCHGHQARAFTADSCCVKVYFGDTIIELLLVKLLLLVLILMLLLLLLILLLMLLLMLVEIVEGFSSIILQIEFLVVLFPKKLLFIFILVYVFVVLVKLLLLLLLFKFVEF